MTGWLAFAAGAGCLAAAALAWSGRWHRWHRQFLLGPLPMPITLLPGVGVGLNGAGLYELGASQAVTAPFFLAQVVGLVPTSGRRRGGVRAG